LAGEVEQERSDLPIFGLQRWDAVGGMGGQGRCHCHRRLW
jgi:hypothetical protein